MCFYYIYNLIPLTGAAQSHIHLYLLALFFVGSVESRTEGAIGVWATESSQPPSFWREAVIQLGHYFGKIVPCGIRDRAVCSLVHFVPRITAEVEMED
jgi:hypothetical protein